MLERRITIRVSPDLHSALNLMAARRSVSLNRLTVEALERFAHAQVEPPTRLPLRELSALLAPAAEAEDLSEEELLHHAREVRRRIWQERYEKLVRSYAPQLEPA
ncbi:MAG: toxin-antitoxin system HicB family antitoxin [Chloroflexi bacterium]|nr:toxin-antitoxin system HicB family antitoxin [Chloroflexota bacterium]